MMSPKRIISALRFPLLGVFFVFFLANEVYSQSVAYKSLLSVLYDEEFPVLKPGELKSLDNFQILDTREKEEYEVSHIEGAQWAGFDSFPEFDVQKLDKNKPVLVYCTVGARSQEIGQKLQNEGFQVFNLYGGIIHWVNENHPVFNENSMTNQVHTYSQSWGIWLKKGEKVY
ncbi:rhodanese-like domain-containing protein [Algoriphagus zhangzhouensis]|uniref:Rhodanese-related sulfurtransferase n=1 Tax=Algoriphagus zhangzhouensis TaxID=1073327 RepID=A0A1M7Z6L7_9BACT|nr:rhodanese-like domain-containing protein [Algoriphagus zhangzhouensis]TDY49150.1 rhodanese-related sulfurtransferase [Algoriphagus zhangzhouensis]SHO60505.1 Rhodanese-related sulfurtransferase [Algoriphagus zhangzhouensis]